MRGGREKKRRESERTSRAAVKELFRRIDRGPIMQITDEKGGPREYERERASIFPSQEEVQPIKHTRLHHARAISRLAREKRCVCMYTYPFSLVYTFARRLSELDERDYTSRGCSHGRVFYLLLRCCCCCFPPPSYINAALIFPRATFSRAQSQ